MELSSQGGALTASSAGGLLLIVAAILMLWKGRFVIDAETKQTTEVELPWGIKFKSNGPVLSILFLAAVLIALPVVIPRVFPQSKQQLGEVDLTAKLKSPLTLEYKAYAVIKADGTEGDLQEAAMTVPALGTQDYEVVYFPVGLPEVTSGQFRLDGSKKAHSVDVVLSNGGQEGNLVQALMAVQRGMSALKAEAHTVPSEERKDYR